MSYHQKTYSSYSNYGGEQVYGAQHQVYGNYAGHHQQQQQQPYGSYSGLQQQQAYGSSVHGYSQVASAGNGATASGYGSASSGNYYSQASHSQNQSLRQDGYSSGVATVGNYNSQIEQAIISAKQPLKVNEHEQIQAGPWRGTFLNKSEVEQFRGPIAISEYKINDDSNPEVIHKRINKVQYTQEVAVKYLNPPLPPKPGDLIIRESQSQVPPAPPVVIRQEGERASTPTPLVLRERPPRAPQPIPEQVVEVEGAPVAPPVRRVVVEKLSNLPPKPQNVIVERWLPYKQQKRRVVYERTCAAAPPNPRNLIIEWEAPEVEVVKVCKDLGVVDADPEEYIRRYGNELKDASQLPSECQNSAQIDDNGNQVVRRVTAAESHQSDLPELEGEVEALRLVDLNRFGLQAYANQVGGALRH